MMKNQTDLIVAIVAFVLTAGSLLGMWLMKRDTVVLSAPTEVPVTAAPLPAGDVTFGDALPGGSSATGMGGGMGGGKMGGMMGGPMGGGMGMSAGKRGMGFPGAAGK